MDLIGKRIQVIGSSQNGREYLYEALDFAAKGKVKVMAETYLLADAPKAYQRVAEGKPRFRAVADRVRPDAIRPWQPPGAACSSFRPDR